MELITDIETELKEYLQLHDAHGGIIAQFHRAEFYKKKYEEEKESWEEANRLKEVFFEKCEELKEEKETLEGTIEDLEDDLSRTTISLDAHKKHLDEKKELIIKLVNNRSIAQNQIEDWVLHDQINPRLLMANADEVFIFNEETNKWEMKN